MGWSLLLDLRVLLAGALIATGLYAAVQRVEKEHVQAEFAQFKADVESEAAKAKVAAARTEALQATHAQEALDGLQTRLDAVSVAYKRLQHASPGSSTVSSIPSAPEVTVSIPGSPPESDTLARCISTLEWGDKELAKYAELWRLQEKNAN